MKSFYVWQHPHSVRMRENTDQKKLRIWKLFTQCVFHWNVEYINCENIMVILSTATSLQCVKFIKVCTAIRHFIWLIDSGIGTRYEYIYKHWPLYLGIPQQNFTCVKSLTSFGVFVVNVEHVSHLFQCFYCWLWRGICLLYMDIYSPDEIFIFSDIS